MEISKSLEQSLSSIHQTLGIYALRKSLSRDAQSMAALLQGFQRTNAKIMENSVTPHKGGTIDIRL